MNPSIAAYNDGLSLEEAELCNFLADVIDRELADAESKIWHAHPVWFLNKNPIVGYSKQKKGIRLMFWSGIDFDEAALNVHGPSFKDASIFYGSIAEVKKEDLTRWLEKARVIQWNYKDIVKNKGQISRIE